MTKLSQSSHIQKQGNASQQVLLSIFTLTLLIFGMLGSANFGWSASAPTSFAPLTKKLLPSVVNIRADVEAKKTSAQSQKPDQQIPRGLEDFFRQFGLPLPNDPQGPGGLPSTAMGSGFIIDESGVVITNNHVIANADKVYVTLQSGEEFEAEIVGKDSKTDLAVLRFDSQGLPITAVGFGDSDTAEVGDWVLAIGNPLGRLGGSVTAGIISARGRNINAGPYDDFIQTDAAINRGNSGGPLFNVKGEVIGINTMILSPNGGSIGIGFSVPSNLASNVIDQLLEFGSTRRGWLGVLIQDITPEIAESLGDKTLKGAMVSDVTNDGPAEEAGFQVGDLIVLFDGKEVESSQKLPILVAETSVGKKVDVEVVRGGDRITLQVVLGQLEKAEKRQLASRGAEPTLREDSETLLGMELAEISNELIERFSIDSYAEGLVVLKVERDSEAEAQGIRPGDLLQKINQRFVSSVEDAKKILDEVRKHGRENVLLLLRSQGNARFTALPVRP